MKYNIIHRQYRIGLGLWFSLKNNIPGHEGTWRVVSNIPEIDLKFLKAKEKDVAVLEVRQMLEEGINLTFEQ